MKLLLLSVLVALACSVYADPDCNGDEGGDAKFDLCGTCCDGNTGVFCGSNLDCAGNCFGSATRDDCTNCNLGMGEECNCVNIGITCSQNCGADTLCFIICIVQQAFCDATCNATLEKDCSGICGGTATDDDCAAFCRDHYSGKLFGLCTAYCKGTHCVNNPHASTNGCDELGLLLSQTAEQVHSLPAGSVNPAKVCQDANGNDIPDFLD